MIHYFLKFLIHHALFALGYITRSKSVQKSLTWIAPQASKTCEVWIPLNPNVFSSSYFRIPDGFFLVFSSFEFWKGYLKDLFPLIHCCWMNFTVGSPSFYSATLGILVYHCFCPFAALGIWTNVVLTTLVAEPFFIFSLFPSFEVSSSKPLTDFLILGGPKGLTSNLSFPKASKHHPF